MFEPKSAEYYSRLWRAKLKEAEAEAGAIPSANPDIWPNNPYVIGKVIALYAEGFSRMISNMFRQAHISTCDADLIPWHAAAEGLSLMPAQSASGYLVVETELGAEIPEGTVFKRADGSRYRTVLSEIAVSESTRVRVIADDPGRQSNTPGGAEFTLASDISGVGAAQTDESGLTGGMDTETYETLRQRVMDRKRNPPRGGSPAEIRRWVKEQRGVTRVWVQRATPAAGSVTVYFMTDYETPDGSPTAAAIDAVKTLIETRSHGGAKIIVSAPTLVPVDITIENLRPDTLAVRDAVISEINSLFLSQIEPGSPDSSFTLSRSWISAAISQARGEQSHKLTEPSDDLAFSEGELAVPGVINFA